MPVLETVTSVFLLAGDGTEQNRAMFNGGLAKTAGNPLYQHPVRLVDAVVHSAEHLLVHSPPTTSI